MDDPAAGHRLVVADIVGSRRLGAGLVARQLVGERWASTLLALVVGAVALVATLGDDSRP
ncbi:MAG: hypothetical protein V4850_26345 [Myxococcota bacterium]